MTNVTETLSWKLPQAISNLHGSRLDQLLAAVDVVRCSGDCCVRHEVDGERGDIGRADHAPDRQRLAKLLATRVQLIAEQRCRQRCVDEAGRDKVDADGCELKRERLSERWYRGGERRDERTRGRPATARSADEQERSARAHLADGPTGDVQRQPEDRVNGAARLCEVDVGQPRVVRAAGSGQDVVDRRWQLVEEPIEALEVGGVKRRNAQRAKFACGALEAFRVAGGENDIGALGPRSPGRLQPDPRAAADHDDRLPGELRFAARDLASETLMAMTW